jgi:hypothetical protein
MKALRSNYDVLVLGGGLGGISAAMRASEQGAKTLLVERYGFLGGMATAGLVNPFMKYYSKDRILSSDIFNDILGRLHKTRSLSSDLQIFNDEMLKCILDEMVRDYGVDLLLHTLFTYVKKKGNLIQSAHCYNKSGRADITARVYIDSTGDGDVAAFAGVSYETGRMKDNACQPMTLCFRVGGIAGNPTTDELRDELTNIFTQAKNDGEIDIPREDVLLFPTLVPGVFHFNTTRVVGKEATNALELTEAEIEARQQTRSLLALFKRRSPRFKKAFLVKAGTQIGVRETRRISGKYTLTEQDVLSARKFEDGIARCNYPIDIHNPTGSGTTLRRLREGEYYEIPYRCLLPLGIKNLLIGSRCVSCTHEAHSSLRIMPVVAGIGEAAGMAASMAVARNITPDRVDGALLKRLLFKKKRVSPTGSARKSDPATPLR